MSERHWATVVCPRCWAGYGSFCTYPGGDLRIEPHVARVRKVGAQ